MSKKHFENQIKNKDEKHIYFTIGKEVKMIVEINIALKEMIIILLIIISLKK